MSEFICYMIKKECANLIAWSKKFNEIECTKLSTKEIIVFSVVSFIILYNLTTCLSLLLNVINITFGMFYPAIKLFHAIKMRMNINNIDHQTTLNNDIERLTKYWIIYALYNITSYFVNSILGTNIFFIIFNITFLYSLITPNYRVDTITLLYDQLLRLANINAEKYNYMIKKIKDIENIIFFYNINELFALRTKLNSILPIDSVGDIQSSKLLLEEIKKH